MSKFPGTVTKVKIRQGASLARGMTIDGHLAGTDKALLYEKWLPDWPKPLEFRGGITAITCEMVLKVPFDEFKKVYKRRAKDIYEVAERNAARYLCQ
jgi:hypothetical protein